MHHVEYSIKLSGSKLFDVVMYNTAKKLCKDFPGLNFETKENEIVVSGDLGDYWYEKYQKEMFGEKDNQNKQSERVNEA